MIGAPFYVMEYVEGTVITSEIPAPLDTPEERRRMGLDLVDALAEVHAVDWRACGLEGFGKPTGYLERQVRRFTGLWEHNKTRELPRVQEVRDWLAANMPDSPEATIVHGDYRLGNTMVAERRPGARDRDLRLGAVDDRRPARGPRLPDGHVGAAGRCRGHDVQLAVGGHAAARASRRATS